MPPEKPARRLGRGLDALFGAPVGGVPVPATGEQSAFREISIGQIASNPFQPRKSFKPAELKELQESLQSSGLLQPITVRPAPGGSGFELIAGERRLRAATNIGWLKIPAVVKDLSDQEILTLALIENLQRADLNPIEEAEGYSQLIDQFGHTQQTVATMVGKDRSTVANVLRILQLPTPVRKLLEEGQLSAGQARPLLALEDEARITALARDIVSKGLSARDVERLVRSATPDKLARGPGRPKKPDNRSADVKSLEQQLRKHFQTDVSIAIQPTGRGSVSIAFYSAEDFERVLEVMGFQSNQH
jgi:ParB family transcriptional regulator, chromosome partitioning protein